MDIITGSFGIIYTRTIEWRRSLKFKFQRNTVYRSSKIQTLSAFGCSRINNSKRSSLPVISVDCESIPFSAKQFVLADFCPYFLNIQ